MVFDSYEGEVQIPYIDLPKEMFESKQGSEEWKELCGKAREACEEYGCFMLGYEGIPAELREEMFMAMKNLFDLPIETKKKNTNPQPTRGYRSSSEFSPLYESFGVDDAHCLDAAQAFTELMWPHGNPAFYRTMNSMSGKMQELELLIQKMILESYGMPTYFDALAENTHPVFCMIKYRPRPAREEAGLGLVAHTDKSYLSILCQDQVKGFELLTKQGHWHQLPPLQEGSFLVIIGEMFKAWSNGRLHAVEHRVVMRGDKERYTYALFEMPKDGEIVKVASELVDDNHPRLFRPFNYNDYINHCLSNISKRALEAYASV